MVWERDQVTKGEVGTASSFAQRLVCDEADCAESSGQGVGGAIGGNSSHQGIEGAGVWLEEDKEYQAKWECLPRWCRWDRQGYAP